MKVYNTLSGQKEEFLPPGSEVRMYVCGVTPYDESHIGHAMSYIIFDVIRRYLKYQGYKVRSVQNVTDIDDKIIDRANRLGIPARELAEQHATGFEQDMKALNVVPPDQSPRATDTIPEIIEFVKGLVKKGYAYAVQGSVYFRVRQVPDYGKLSHRTLEQMKAGARIEPGEGKEDPMDFVLWKAAKPGEPSWDSPWGKGRPGWHIECSAMSVKYLGEQIDIHGGGQDLIFPHHENEIAQSECFTGRKPFVKYWMHNGLLQLGAEKMSKSLGNLITIREALQKYSPDAIRLFILSSHYRSPLTYSEEALEAAERGAERLRQAVQAANAREGAEKIDLDTYRKRFVEAMDDDFNTAQAVAALFDLARGINRASEEGFAVSQAQQTFKELSGVLGLTLKSLEQRSSEKKLYEEAMQLYEEKNFEEIPKRIEVSFSQLDKSQAVSTSLLGSLSKTLKGTEFINLQNETRLHKEALDSLHSRLRYATPQAYEGVLDDLRNLDATASASTASYIKIREQLRRDKQFQLADEIRAKLNEMGIVLEDTPDGTVWKYEKGV